LLFYIVWHSFFLFSVVTLAKKYCLINYIVIP